MFAPAVLCLRLFCYEEQKGDVIAVFAIALFLVGTRNLMLRCVLADIVPSLR